MYNLVLGDLYMALSCNISFWEASSVADPDPDPKDPHHFSGSGSIIFFMDPDPDPDPDLNLAHHRSPPPAHLIFHI